MNNSDVFVMNPSINCSVGICITLMQPCLFVLLDSHKNCGLLARYCFPILNCLVTIFSLNNRSKRFLVETGQRLNSGCYCGDLRCFNDFGLSLLSFWKTIAHPVPNRPSSSSWLIRLCFDNDFLFLLLHFYVWVFCCLLKLLLPDFLDTALCLFSNSNFLLWRLFFLALLIWKISNLQGFWSFGNFRLLSF